MRTLVMGLAAVLIGACGGSPSGTAASPAGPEPLPVDPYSVDQLLAAPTSLSLANATLTLATLFQNRLPWNASPPVEGATSLSGRVWVVAAGDGFRVSPASVSALDIWVIRGRSVWHVLSHGTSRPNNILALDLPDGPFWGPTGTVDVVALLSDGNASGLVRVPDQSILTTYGPVGSVFDSVPETAMLAGQELKLSPILLFSFPFHGWTWIWYPCFAGVEVRTPSFALAPPQVRVLRAWMINRETDTAWMPANPAVLAGNGPRWGVRRYDAVAEVTDGSRTVLLKATEETVSLQPRCC